MTRIWTLIDALWASAAARWTAVPQLRLQTRLFLTERRAWRRQHALVARPEQRSAQSEDWLEAEVLRVITLHPDGVRAFEIGNELGIDWRSVPAVAARLVDRAIVEQVGHAFYPVTKAS